MGRQLDNSAAQDMLKSEFIYAEKDFLSGQPIGVNKIISEATTILFTSNTQAYREALLGCIIAKILDSKINIRSPYMNQADDAFNGRTLDEKVVNPFLHDRSIPSSKGPYLSTFRRNVRFEKETAKGLRDKAAYAAMLNFIRELEAANQTQAKDLLRYLLYFFVKLRNDSTITIARIQRLSIEQYEKIITALLQTPSGGLLPVLLSVAMFKSIKNHFKLSWTIDFQGINVADKAAGAGGDITIKQDGNIVLAIEVTERPIDRSRVVSTFTTKIAPHGIEDYLFFFSSALPHDDAKIAARHYFAQGHDISFLSIKEWLLNNLGTLGTKGRATFTKEFLSLLDNNQVPGALKVAWNDLVRGLLN